MHPTICIDYPIRDLVSPVIMDFFSNIAILSISSGGMLLQSMNTPTLSPAGSLPESITKQAHHRPFLDMVPTVYAVR